MPDLMQTQPTTTWEPAAFVPAAGPRARRTWMFPAAALGIVCLALWFRGDAPRVAGGINDFLGMYAGARLVGSPEQFNAAAYLREQVEATRWSAPSLLYTRLPVFAVLLRPLAKLAYRHAYYLWQILSVLALVAALTIWPYGDRAMLLLAACWSLPLFASLAGGQDIAFLLLIMAIAWRLAPARPRLAGAVLALVALKFHLFLLLPVFLIAQRRCRMLSGAGMTGAAIVAGCFAVAGLDWIPQYARFALQGQANPNVRAMPNLHGLLDGLPHAMSWEIGGAIVAAAAVAWIARRASFAVGFSVALVGSLLTSHHAYAADALLLLPALLTLVDQVRGLPVRALSIMLLSPLPFLIKPLVPLTAPAPLLLLALLAAMTAAMTAAVAGGRRALPDGQEAGRGQQDGRYQERIDYDARPGNRF